MKNKLTILIPCFNKEKFLKKLFKSLLKQKDKKFFLIFVDDKSTDSTFEMLIDFQKNNSNHFNDLQIFRLEKNQGISYVRNFLIEKVETEYFIFLDPDDKFYPRAIYHFNKKIQTKKYDVVLAKNRMSFAKTVYIPNVISNFYSFKKNLDNNSNIGLLWIERTGFFVWNKAINTKWFKSLNLNFANDKNYEDIPVVGLMLSLAKNVGFIDKYTLVYDVNMSGLSRIHNPKKFKDLFSNLNFLYENLEKYNLLNKWKNETKIEEMVIGKLFIHCFIRLQGNKVIKNFQEYLSVMDTVFNFLEKYNIEEKLKNYTSIFRLILNSALKHFQKIKILYSKYKNKD
ncbi:glycosyltransferase family 2 protein [Mycoplasma iguanae]|uniref:Glycosyltransferase family 2 protein n=1 Tax=Mycoplasma iguanae TaxID=292461 RepID=A0ABY5RAI9_9MOLU|nr:glycosyltransferase family 2 protein [Mycoplasma iguanae]UVD81630.1 glycosyltransferase family 2 protein [Mycoplasma iguanae]